MIPVCQNSLNQINLPIGFALQIKLTLGTSLLVTLAFKIAKDACVEQCHLIRFIFAVAFLNDKRIVGIVAGAKIVSGASPRFFSHLQTFNDLAEVVFIQSEKLDFTHNTAYTPGQVEAYRQDQTCLHNLFVL